MQGKLLGHILLQQGLISEAHLDYALALSNSSSSRLGDVLVSEGIIGYPAVYQALAMHHQLPFVDLLQSPPDASLLEETEIDNYFEMLVVPWKKIGTSLWLATSEFNENTMRWARLKYGDSIHFAVTSPRDIQRSIEAHFSATLNERSRLSLWKKSPISSAYQTLTSSQKLLAFLLMCLGILAGFYWWYATFMALFVLCHTVFFATIMFKFLLFIVGVRKQKPRNWQEEINALDEKSLPVYSILIPMYKEAQKLPHMLSAMQQMDYPAAKLDIKLVLEEDDVETLSAAYALKPSYLFEIIRVPKSHPRTKPKACNYALRFCRGEYVCVYDADDEPEPTQLKKAILTFRSLPRDVICLQARLEYYNDSDNWLTRCFSIEYNLLFHFWLLGMQRLHIPLPLGGTSNHIALKPLRDIGEWDPFNVTEDADLGTRLSSRGFKTHMLDSFTREEATNTAKAWLNQRARWIKGYMQTWLVHMRAPLRLYKSLKIRGFAGFQFVTGLSTFVYLTTPIVWGILPFWLFGLLPNLPTAILYFAYANLFLYLTTQLFCTLYVVFKVEKPCFSSLCAAISYPFYLLLHTIASYKALWQLIVKPHSWNKTTHGVAKKRY